jgi:hypothetical protein
LTIVATDEDYYYAYLTKDKKIRLTTCVLKYKVCENQELNIFINKEEIAEMLKKDFDSNDCDEVILYRGMFDFKLR